MRGGGWEMGVRGITANKNHCVEGTLCYTSAFCQKIAPKTMTVVIKQALFNVFLADMTTNSFKFLVSSFKFLVSSF